MQRIRIPDGKPDQDLVDAAAAAILRGELIVLPTETVYGVTADPRQPEAVERLRDFKGRDTQTPFTFHLADVGSLEELAIRPPNRVRRYLDRVWPGPLTVILPAPKGSVGLRVPAHDFTRAVIRKVGHGLFMTSVNKAGEDPLTDPDAIAGLAGISMLCDAGTNKFGVASTVVRFEDGRLEVLREGLLSGAEVMAGCAVRILFVCSGNTCRSPMAELLASHIASTRLQVAPEQLLAHGLLFGSAGTGTFPGMPASEGAIAAMDERGLQLDGHRSSSLHPEMIQDVKGIYCMATSHAHRILDLVPDAVAKTTLLRPDGKDIADPFGGSLKVYRATGKEIESALNKRMKEFMTMRDEA